MKKFSIVTITLSILLAQSALACPLLDAVADSLTDKNPKASLKGNQLPQPAVMIKGLLNNGTR